MELIRALGALSEAPAPEHVPIASVLDLGPVPEASVYTDVFLFHLYPYAAVYLGAEGMLGGEARDRIAGFWTALGYSPPAEPDHLGALLGLWATLEEAIAGEEDAAERALLEHAVGTLLTEHLTSWLPAYLRAVERLAPPYYRRWGGLLSDTLASRTQVLDLQAHASMHFESLPALPDPRSEGGPAFLEAVLAPGRSGMILARADMARAARALELGFRLGERSYQLKALLSQDPGAVLAWLAGEAEDWARWCETAPWAPESARRHWYARAEHSAELLTELAREGWQDAGETVLTRTDASG